MFEKNFFNYWLYETIDTHLVLGYIAMTTLWCRHLVVISPIQNKGHILTGKMKCDFLSVDSSRMLSVLIQTRLSFRSGLIITGLKTFNFFTFI